MCSPASHTSHVTRHTSHVTRHTSHVTRHTSHVTRHKQHNQPVFRSQSCVELFARHLCRQPSLTSRAVSRDMTQTCAKYQTHLNLVTAGELLPNSMPPPPSPRALPPKLPVLPAVVGRFNSKMLLYLNEAQSALRCTTYCKCMASRQNVRVQAV